MKRIAIFTIVLLIAVLLPGYAHAQESEYSDYDEYSAYLSEFDLSGFDELDEDTKSILDELGLSDFDYENIMNFSFSDFVNAVVSMFTGAAETPLQALASAFVFIILSSMFQSFNTQLLPGGMSGLFSTVSSLVIAVVLASQIKNTVATAAATISVTADFVYAFIPTFCIIVAASGNTLAAFSTNTLLLSLAQALNFISKSLFIPLANCFLSIGICAGLRADLNLNSLVKTLKKYITTAISVAAAAFVSILSIKTAVAAKADAIGLRSIRFAINSVVPVIGSAISEGLLSIQSYSSLVRTSVGVVGIVAVALVFLPAIIEVVFWRFSLSLGSIMSDVFGDSSVSLVIKAFSDALLIMNVILILSMVTTVISIGILIAAKGSS
ncbi:MAG: hypothetical protein LUH82_00245 [Clostridiales bacterium]|nr:hypothetical protein [Clostridiales bacterium]